MIRKYRNNKKVIYTCLIGGYDKLINHKYINPDWDYICFTDDLSIKNKNNSSWKVKPLIFNKLDDVRNQRWHKINAHLILSEYGESLYLDTNIEILNDGIFKDIEKVKNKKNVKISLGHHFERDNLFDEFKECKRLGKDNLDILNTQEKKIRETGFSGKFGTFFENNIIYRKHNDEEIIKIMDEWWWWVRNYSRRDQLSLVYVLWKNNYKIFSLNDKTYREGDKVKFIFDENHVTKEELLLQRNNLHNDLCIKNKEIENKDKEIDMKNKEIENKDKEIDMKNGENYNLREENEKIEKELLIMKSSKFWKLRNIYLKLKHYFIFVLLNPRKFIKKYFRKIFSSKDPLVSVIIPVYDRTIELEESINSILNQSYENVELILVTDGSPRETLDVLDKYKDNKKIKIFYYEDNTGNAVRGRNKGIKEARGEFVAFQDSDDIADENRIELSLECINRYNADLVYGGWRAMVDGSRLDTGLKNGQEIISPDCDINTLLNICVPCQSTVMVKRSALIDVGGLKDKMEYREDHELWLRLMYFRYKFKSIPKILTNLRIHGGNNELNFKDGDLKWKEMLEKEYKNKQNFFNIKNT